MSPDVAAELRREVAAAGRGARGAVVARWAANLGVSRATVYRSLSSPGSRKAARASTVKEAWIVAISTIRAQARDVRSGRELPADLAVREAEKRGLIPADVLTPSTYLRAARRLGHRREKPCRRFQASRANECHQVDVSGSEYLTPIRERGDWVIRVIVPTGTSRKNRPPRGEGHPKVWCCLVVDDFSRVAFGRYFVAPGESSAEIVAVLAEAWGDRGDWRLPLRGIPERLFADNGPLTHSQVGKQFLRKAGVEIVGRTPYNPRATGKVERCWRTMWQRFEQPFLLDPGRTMSLDELNGELTAYLAEQNALAHPVYRETTRVKAYLGALGAVAMLPEDAAALAYREEERLVRTDRTILYQGRAYQAPAEWLGERIMVSRSIDGRVALVRPSTGEIVAAEPHSPDAMGWKAERGVYADTPADAIRRLAREQSPAQAPARQGALRMYVPFGATRREPETPFSPQLAEYTPEGARGALGRALRRPYSSLPPEVCRPFEDMLTRDRSVRAVDVAIDAISAELTRAKEGRA